MAAPHSARLTPEDPSAAEIAVHLLPASEFPSPPSLTVFLPSALLSRVPYFATKLKEPWCPSTSSSEPLQITLHCSHTSSPPSYAQCLQLLDEWQPFSPRMFDSIEQVLSLLPVADHLLFQECWDACMGFLAAIPWSHKEEDDIRATLSTLSLQASDDVKERLDTSQDVASVEAILRHMASSPAMESSLSNLCNKYLISSPARIKEVFHSLLLKMWASYSPANPTPCREWYVLTKLLLQFTDAHEVILHLIDSQEVFSSLLYATPTDRYKDCKYIIKEVLQKVLSRAVPLNNAQRAVLVTRCNVKFKDEYTESMRLMLAETLPLNHPVRRDMVKMNPNLHSEWFHHLFHRVDNWGEQLVEALKPATDANIPRQP
eukprot:c2130_g1_i1 orf=151-1272(-)